MNIVANYSLQSNLFEFKVNLDKILLEKKLTFDIKAPNILLCSYGDRIIKKIVFKDFQFYIQENLDLCREENNSIQFKVKCNPRSIKSLLKCKCIEELNNKLIESHNLCCQFCLSCFADVENVSDIKVESISEFDSSESLYCCNHDKEDIVDSRTTVSEQKCINYGHEIEISKILLTPERLNNHKNILSCIRCDNIIGRYDTMLNGQLKLYPNQLKYKCPTIDIDGDIVGFNFDDSHAIKTNYALHSITTYILLNKTFKLQLSCIDRRSHNLTDYMLISNDCDVKFNYDFLVQLEPDENIRNTTWYSRTMTLSYITAKSEEFSLNLECWERDMSVAHIFLPEEICEVLSDSLNNLKVSEIQSLHTGFREVAVPINDCLV